MALHMQIRSFILLEFFLSLGRRCIGGLALPTVLTAWEAMRWLSSKGLSLG